MQPDRNASQPSRNGVARSTVFSVAIHAILLISIAGVFHHAPKIAPYRFPGPAQGMQLLTYYSPGSMVSGKSDIAPKVVDKQKAAAVVHAKVAPPKQEDAADVRTERGIAT